MESRFDFGVFVLIRFCIFLNFGWFLLVINCSRIVLFVVIIILVRVRRFLKKDKDKLRRKYENEYRLKIVKSMLGYNN